MQIEYRKARVDVDANVTSVGVRINTDVDVEREALSCVVEPAAVPFRVLDYLGISDVELR